LAGRRHSFVADPRVKRVVANCPWWIGDFAARAEEGDFESQLCSISSGGVREGYRLSERNWKKLLDGKFYNPMYRAAEVDATKS